MPVIRILLLPAANNIETKGCELLRSGPVASKRQQWHTFVLPAAGRPWHWAFVSGAAPNYSRKPAAESAESEAAEVSTAAESAFLCISTMTVKMQCTCEVACANLQVSLHGKQSFRISCPTVAASRSSVFCHAQSPHIQLMRLVSFLAQQMWAPLLRTNAERPLHALLGMGLINNDSVFEVKKQKHVCHSASYQRNVLRAKACRQIHMVLAEGSACVRRIMLVACAGYIVRRYFKPCYSAAPDE